MVGYTTLSIFCNRFVMVISFVYLALPYVLTVYPVPYSINIASMMVVMSDINMHP